MRYHANIEPLQAEEMLRSGARLTPDGIRHFVKAATGDDKAADSACARAVIEEERKKQSME